MNYFLCFSLVLTCYSGHGHNPLLGLPGVDLSAPLALTSSTTNNQVTTSNSATSKTTSVWAMVTCIFTFFYSSITQLPHTTASGLHNATTSIGHQVTPTASSAVASASSTASSSNSGSVAGGVAVGIIALSALVCLVVYLVVSKNATI